MAIRTRRDFLKASALTVGSFVISTGFSGCGSDSNNNSGTPVSFNHGVASGDPLTDRVILWTRVTPEVEVNTVAVAYEVATDENFENLVRSAETAIVNRDGDFTLKVDFQNLTAGTVYYYRFRVGETLSPTGRTKTLPTETSHVKMAVFSCSNYPKGFFNAYTEAAGISDLDVSVHLGDYIYEYGMFEADGVTPAYATENAVEIGRALPEGNDTELLTLEDYRSRYALYHTDNGTQTIHAAAPMIVVWDDHEVANDAYTDGAENHNDGEGTYSDRKLAALQAYFEWLPIRPASENDTETIYRAFDFGDLVSLYMLDTRQIGRNKQLSYGDYPKLLSEGDSSNFLTDLTNVDRTMLGTDQLQWLQGKMSTSTATWQVLGQQVLMGRMNLPAEILGLIGQLEYVSGEQQTQLLTALNTTLGELAMIKGRILQNDPTLTAEEIGRVQNALPYNLDAWDGYFTEREVILGTAAQLGKNLVVLAGDTHNSWANELKALDESQQPTIPVGVEFATPAVSSPGLEEYAGLSTDEAAIQFESVISLLIDDLKYFNANNRGFVAVTFTPTEATAEWIYVDNINTTTYNTLTPRLTTFKTTTTAPTLTQAT